MKIAKFEQQFKIYQKDNTSKKAAIAGQKMQELMAAMGSDKLGISNGEIAEKDLTHVVILAGLSVHVVSIMAAEWESILWIGSEKACPVCLDGACETKSLKCGT